MEDCDELIERGDNLFEFLWGGDGLLNPHEVAIQNAQVGVLRGIAFQLIADASPDLVAMLEQVAGNQGGGGRLDDFGVSNMPIEPEVVNAIFANHDHIPRLIDLVVGGDG